MARCANGFARLSCCCCRAALQLLRHAQLGAAGAGVARYLIGRGDDGLSGKHLEYRLLAAHAHRKIGRAGATVREALEHILDDAVLKRVVADHADAPAGVRPADGSFQAAFQNVELAVDFDAQGLERALGRVSASAARACWDSRLDDVDQLRARFKRGL